MPSRPRNCLEVTKAYQAEKLILRTERRLAQLRQDQRELEIKEVWSFLSLLWLTDIILFYTGLYLG
jgi:hypothetical protein